MKNSLSLAINSEQLNRIRDNAYLQIRKLKLLSFSAVDEKTQKIFLSSLGEERNFSLPPLDDPISVSLSPSPLYTRPRQTPLIRLKAHSTTPFNRRRGQPHMNWLPILKKCAQKIRKDVIPFYATPNASITFGKGAGGDPMKKIDLIAEKALIETLQENKVSCTLISEETGVKEIGSHPHEYYLTTDPIDGTTNATRGIPFIATSIAVSKTPNLQSVQTAIVTDLLHNITYTAQKGKGAHKNNKKIKPATTTTLEEAVIGVDLNTYKIKQVANQLNQVLEKTRHIRHLGANALELCYVADGTTDAFIDIRGKLRITDVAAAHLIIKEAGALMLTPQGKEINVPLDPAQRVSFIATANATLYETIKKLLA